MRKNITSKEVADQFAAAPELLLNWIDQRMEMQKPGSKEEKPIRKLDENNLLNAVEVSNLLGVSASYVYRLMPTNNLPTIRIGGSVRIRKGDLDEAIESLKSHPPEE